MYLGDFTVGDTLHFKFTTRQFSTGAPFTLAGTPALAAYEDDSTTQITAGITLTADFDSVTGLNHVTVVASGANGFEAGKQYDVVITTGTVDSVSVVGEVVGRFSLQAAYFDKAGYAIGAGGIDSTSFAAGALDAAALAQDAAREIADEVLDRNLAGGGSGNTRNVRNALRALRNRSAIAGGTLTVYQEDDSTAAFTAAVTTAAGDPISEVDPT